MKKEDQVKIYSRVTKTLNEDIESIAIQFNMTKSQVISLTAGIGSTYLKALTNPESLISAEKMAKVFSESEKLGVEFKKPDEIKNG